MASVKIDNYIIDIVVHSLDGVFKSLFQLPYKNGFWVFLTVRNNQGTQESFPAIDKDNKIKIYDTYSEAINDVAALFKKYVME